jgi:hypothetical protein
LNVTHQILVYADRDVSLLGESVQTAKKNTEGLLLDNSKQIGLEANATRTNISLCLMNRMQDMITT